MSRAATLLVVLVLVACDIPVERAADGPIVLGTDPADGDVGIDRATELRVFFDRQLYPRDLHRGNVRVQSGARSAFLSAWFEPVERVLHAEIIGAPLDPEVRYRFSVEDLRALDGVPMDGPHVVAFDTGTSADGSSPPPSVSWGEVAPILAECAREGCHGGEVPVLGLDLGTPEGVRATAIGVAAQQTRVGTQEEAVWHGVPTLAGLAVIDVVGGVGRPARSYLMHKLLGELHVERLSASELSLLSWWIRGGALTE